MFAIFRMLDFHMTLDPTKSGMHRPYMMATDTDALQFCMSSWRAPSGTSSRFHNSACYADFNLSGVCFFNKIILVYVF